MIDDRIHTYIHDDDADMNRSMHVLTSGLDVICGDVAVGVAEQLEQLGGVDAHSVTAAALNYSCEQTKETVRAAVLIYLSVYLSIYLSIYLSVCWIGLDKHMSAD